MSVVKFLPINGLRSFCCQRNRFHTAAVVWSSKSVQNYQFKELDGVIDPYSSSIVRNDRYNSKAEQEVKETLVRVRHGGSKSAHERHTMKNNKLFARDRLKKLLDPGTEEDFLEIAPFAGLGMEYGDVPAAGIVSIIGRIHNKWCLVGNNDATVKGGTSFPITVEKQIRTQDIALQNCLPVIYGVDSGGAFLPLQASIFPDRKHGGRVFYNEAILSSLGIPQIAIVCGSCTAGGAYVPTMAEETVIIDKTGTIFLGGPPLVFAATGEKISSENLGGATLHCKVSGCTDYFARTEDEAWQFGRDIVSTLDVVPPEDPVEWEEPLYDQEELRMLAPTPYDQSYYSIKKILARLVDGSKMHEFKSLYGPTLITGFAHIKGHIVGILANDGTITADAALKGAHFISICQQRHIPLVFLQNVTSEEEVSSPEEAGELLKARAKLLMATASSTVPKITLIVGNSFGPNNYIMCGRSMDPNFLFSWPLAQIGLMTPTQAAKAMKQLSNDPASEEVLVSVFKEKSCALYSSANLWDDGIILPQETRRVLAQCLSITSQKKYWYKNDTTNNTHKFGIFRM
ncbi:biotin-dependent 3-methylcrotonyl-coenzyme A carboxylase beta1 subunit-like isoform X2 [Apostichopus japonicus]